MPTKVLKSESQIISGWAESGANNPLVSICCIAYNHEKYIGDALNGFLSQNTSFPFEILIHDDASTDGTAAIIQEYQSRYPNLITAIYQKQNQYQKVKTISPKFLYPIAKGKFVAMCEGDDYWFDQYKLQLQIDALQQYPEYAICFADYTSTPKKAIPAKLETNPKLTFFSPEESFKLDGGGMKTPTLVMETDILRANSHLFEGVVAGDIVAQTICSSVSGSIKLERPVAFYRVHTSSWSNSVNRRFEKKREW